LIWWPSWISEQHKNINFVRDNLRSSHNISRQNYFVIVDGWLSLRIESCVILIQNLFLLEKIVLIGFLIVLASLHHQYVLMKKLFVFLSMSMIFPISSWPWSYGSWIYNYLCNQCLSSLMLWVQILIRARCTKLCDKVC
jgi:hypothetical protein